jgi:rare lipoprotein A (peptidoglycan hydrolase)
MRGNMKMIATATALVLSVGMAAASNPGTTKASSSAAQNSTKTAEKSPKAATQPSAQAETSSKVAHLGKPTKKKPQIGTASWYGGNFQGKPTASGEPYDMYQFTAAHRELPMGSWLKVTNMRTGKWLIVRINDRGPFVGDRILDLSGSAAEMLDIKARGVGRVKLEVVDEPAIVANASSFALE